MENLLNVANNCEINLILTILTWFTNCVITDRTPGDQATTFVITDIKLYVPVVSLSADDNVKLLRHFLSGFQRTIKWNKYQSKETVQVQN